MEGPSKDLANDPRIKEAYLGFFGSKREREEIMKKKKKKKKKSQRLTRCKLSLVPIQIVLWRRVYILGGVVAVSYFQRLIHLESKNMGHIATAALVKNDVGRGPFEA